MFNTKCLYLIEFDDIRHVVFFLQFVLMPAKCVHAVMATTYTVLVFLLQHRGDR